ncbi:hypothetical protein OAO01_08990 [Oligoflexia bacterium]|nr:hypothetical protein [Oligoflexia bacterium]
MICTCSNCNTAFEITSSDLAFYDRVAPIVGETKFPLSTPSRCPDCRQQRRLAICNERFLYPGKCGLCSRATPTEHPPHSGQPIFCRECWHSDKWDPQTYGRDFDFSRPFFEQWVEVKRATPAQALSIQGTNENSEYIHYAGFSKNSYLIMHADHCEDCYYGYGIKRCTNCVDGFYNIYCELCYDCIDCHRCYGLTGSQDCVNCNDSAFLRDCVGCNHCFLSTGLRNVDYCWENQQLSKDEYAAQLAKVNLSSYSQYLALKQRRHALERNHSFRAYQGHNLENCIGTHMYNCKNVEYSFDCDDVEDGKYLYQIVIGAKDVYDIYQYGNNLQLSYDCAIVGLDSYRILFCHETHTCSDVLYGWYMESCKNCFGCANMHNKEFCILNKQFSKNEYEKTLPKIIEHMLDTGEWGEFIPPEYSIFGYNRTTAQLYYPLSKAEADSKGFPWDTHEPPLADVKRVVRVEELPDKTTDLSDDILNCAIQCEVTKRLFRITPHELKFYRRQDLPFPRRSPDQRHVDRFQQRNPRRFWERTCTSCRAPILTTYAPESPFSVVCEKCYLETVY